VAAAACGMPKDPQRTLERVRGGGTVRVGMAENPPWTRVEADLVRAFAEELGAKVEWTAGAESVLLEGVEAFQLDLVVGGLRDDTPYAPKLGLTRPFLTFEVHVGLSPGADAPSGGKGLEGLRVGVRRGSRAAKALEKHGAVPIGVSDPASVPGPRAGSPWQLEAWGYRPIGPALDKGRQVMAVPAGENGWLLALDKFLWGREEAVYRALLKEAR
jgi:polar amino acid transport system substrate-binding protein